jgi:hypothetical protein
VLIKSFGSRPRANVVRAFLHRYTTLGNFTSLFFLHKSQVTTTCDTTIYMSVQLVPNTSISSNNSNGSPPGHATTT